MRYLRGFKFSDTLLPGPNIYPYNTLNSFASEMLIFDSVTFLYGDNGSGKSTLLNLLANQLNLAGKEQVSPYGLGNDYFQRYLAESFVLFADDEFGQSLTLPENSRYIKSEDILYEIKKIQQEAIQREGYLYERKQLGMTKEQLRYHKNSPTMEKQIQNRIFSQEKYSNGETAFQVFQDYLQPNGLYLLDEPEVSLSPENQLLLIDLINQAARFHQVQFIIASHSPLLLGGVEGKIYHLKKEGLEIADWQELPIVQLYLNFFKQNYTTLSKKNQSFDN